MNIGIAHDPWLVLCSSRLPVAKERVVKVKTAAMKPKNQRMVHSFTQSLKPQVDFDYPTTSKFFYLCCSLKKKNILLNSRQHQNCNFEWDYAHSCSNLTFCMVIDKSWNETAPRHQLGDPDRKLMEFSVFNKFWDEIKCVVAFFKAL